MDHACRRIHARLEEFSRRVSALSPARHLETAARPPAREIARRHRHRGRRRHGGELPRACYILIKTGSAFPIRVPTKNPTARPHLSKHTPPPPLPPGGFPQLTSPLSHPARPR